MTITITVHVANEGQPDYSHSIVPSKEALDTVRFDFNPSANIDVVLAKALHAGIITMAEGEQQRAIRHVPRWAALAITHAETAAMFLVKAVTYK